MPDERLLEIPARVVAVEPNLARLEQGVEDFAEDVELKLVVGRVPHADRGRVFIAGEPGDFKFAQPPLAPEAVHDLNLRRVPRHRADEPRPPRGGLVFEPGSHQRVEREGGVAEPAEPVVPVAHASNLLGQRGRRSGHDPARGREGQRLQRDERPQDRLAPLPLEGALRRPRLPPALGPQDRLLGVQRRGLVLVRGVVREVERDEIPLRDHEFGKRGHIFTAQRDAREQAEAVRPGHRDDPPVHLADPGDDRAEVEPDHELHPHRDAAPVPLDDPDHARRAVERGHAVHHRDRPLLGLELGLQDERAGAISPGDPLHLPRWRDQPATIGGRAQGARRSTAPSRTGGRTASRSSHPCRRARRPGSRR